MKAVKLEEVQKFEKFMIIIFLQQEENLFTLRILTTIFSRFFGFLRYSKTSNIRRSNIVLEKMMYIVKEIVFI